MSRIGPIILSATLLVLAACGGGSDDESSTTTTTGVVAITAASTAPTSTTAASTPTSEHVVEGATVVVANGNIVGGSAGRMSDQLALAGFEVGTAVDGTTKIEESVVYYTNDATAEAVAESVAVALGGIDVKPIPATPPIDGEFTDDVLLLLGDAQADQPLTDIGGTSAAADIEAVENSGSTVVVANASGISGSAGRMSDDLEAAGFTMGTPTNSTADATESVVYYDESGATAAVVKADADVLAITLGGLTVLALPDDVPTESGSLDGDILLVLGSDEADMSLAELAG